MKRTVLLLLGAFCCCIWHANAQTGLTVTLNDGSELPFSIAEAGKIYFSETELLIDENGNNTTERVALSSIRKMVFGESSSISDVDSKSRYVIYPNPSYDHIRIASSEATEQLNISIFSLSGQMLLQGVYSPNTSINIAHLAAGFYLIKVNDKTFKFSKL
ncbi:T9SS type A sorting domain-containing protein [Bacteroidales bacterium OttesenSCG-928-J16]|nr:T9SS type A sorting domain-containing protein [Bacteroidales bacterium OttesenSCG-928-J16]